MDDLVEVPPIDIHSLPGPEDILRVEFDNGITVLARHNPHSPAVITSGYLRCGAMSETRQTAGLAMMTGSSLSLGTEHYSKREIDERLEAVGAKWSFGLSKSNTTFFTKCLTEDLQPVLGLLADALRSPTFPEHEFDDLKARKLTGLKQRDQDTFSMALIACYEMIYGEHPYGITLDGYQSSVEALSATQCRAFHSSHYHPDGMVVVVVGGIEPAQAVDRVAKALEDWRPKFTPSESQLPEWKPPEKGRQRHIPLKDRSQCDVIMGTTGPGPDQDDYIQAFLGNSILGQYGLSGRLGQSVREEAGLAYYAQSSLVLMEGSPPWVLLAGVAPENVDAAVDLMRAELQKFTTDLVSEQEYKESQAYQIGALPLGLESNEAVAEALVDLVHYDLGLDYFQRLPAMIKAVTRENILETAQRYIKLDQMMTAIAGPIEAWEE